MNQAELYKQYSIGQYEYGLKLIELLAPRVSDKVLDIGSGTGNLTYNLANRVGSSGEVLAIDPDTQRMAVAKVNQPVKITNINWYNDTVLSYPKHLSNKFNLAFSNYVFHWIQKQDMSLNKVYEALMPGGKFAISVVCGHPELIEDLMMATGFAGERLRNRFFYRSKDSWLDLFKSVGFAIKQIVPVDHYHFNNLNDMLIWWQATTHGGFSMEQLSTKSLAELKKKYPGAISIYGEEILSLIAEKK